MENVIVVKFNIENEAYKAFSEFKKKISNDCIISQLVIVKRNGKEYEIKENYDSGINTQDDAFIGGLTGGLIGIIGGPLGILFFGSLGALLGSTMDIGDQITEYSAIEHITESLEDGETAIIGLIQENDENYLNLQFKDYDVDIIRFDAAEIAQEVEELEEQRRIEEKEAIKAKREELKAERKAKIEEKKKNIKEHFSKIKNNN